MRVGVVSNSELCLPLLFFLKDQQLDVRLFLGATKMLRNKEALLQACQQRQVPVTVESPVEQDLYTWMQVDVVFVIGYKRMIKLELLPFLKYGIFNIHFGMLPYFRGPNPVFWQLKTGASSVGLCIHTLVSEPDAGPIAWQKSFAAEEHFSYSYLNYMFSNIVIEGVVKILRTIQSGKPIHLTQQNEQQAQWFASPAINDVLIDWDKMNSSEIVNLVSACDNWNYGAITSVGQYELKIINAFIHPSNSQAPPGTITDTSTHVTVSCCDGNLLNVTYLSVNGIMFHSRFAEKYGIVTGVILGTNSMKQ